MHKIYLFLQIQVGLLIPQATNSGRNFAVLRKRLNLTLDDVDEQCPNDIAYVHSVYAPISIRLIDRLHHGDGWRGIRDLLDLLPGPILEETQKVPGYNVKNKKDRQITLILFVGGCTFAEISALRFLSEQEDSNVDYLVATTSIINGDKFVKELMTDVVDCLQF